MATKKKTATAHTSKEKTAASSRKATKNESAKKSTTSSGKRKAAATSSSKSGAAKSSASARSKRSEIDVPDIRKKKKGTSVSSEILLWVILAFCIILFLGNTFQAGGMIGRAVSGFFFGMFGIMAYCMPIVLFLLTAFVIANRGRMRAWVKVIAALLLLISLSCFFALVTNPVSSSDTLGTYYASCMREKTGGGIAGGMVYMLFHPTFGEIGTWICNIILFIIGMVMMTGYSFFDSIREGGGSALGQARSHNQMKRELYHQKKKQESLRRQAQMLKELDTIRYENQDLAQKIREPRRQRIVTGVSKNTTFDMRLPVSEDVHEIIPKIHSTEEAQEPVIPVVLDPSRAKTVEEAVPELKEQEAKKEKSEKKEDKLQFTIQRNGSSQMISSKIAVDTTVKKEEAVSIQPSPAKPVPETFMPEEEQQPDIHPDKQADFPEANETKTEDISAKTKIKNPHSSAREQEQAVESVAEEIKLNEEAPKPEYVFPPLDLLSLPSSSASGNSNDEVTETARKLQDTLHSFGVNVTVTNVSCGPAVTRYELQPEQGVKVSKIVNLADDIKLNLAAEDIRIEAPIPGKAAVGIEVPNRENSAVYLRELLESKEFQSAKSNLSFAVGKDIAGKVVVTDIAKMPHLLIAGATGSGKSVCINTLIMSILYKANPEDVKLIMIDPKVVELSVYNGIPHLFIPVVTDPKKASGALNWGVAEMTKRYELFAKSGVRDLKGYNAKVEALADVDDPDKPKKLPQIIIIVDELADLMMVAPGEVEDAICRLAQLARAAGIHLIIATQRPSVNVITGLIKANMPSRIAFSVTSGVDSRTILDMTGAEKLLGKGDMLFYPQGYSKPVRVQGSFVSDAEVSKVTEFLTQKNDMDDYQKEMESRMNTVAQSASFSAGGASSSNDLDSHFAEAGKFIIEKDRASIGMLQRVFKIGFNRAARIMDQLCEAGVVGPEEGTKPRKVLMSMEEFEQYIDEIV